MISAILLAAGESRRMGERNKLLLPFKQKTIIEHIAETLHHSDAGEVIVVVGHQAEKVRKALPLENLIIVENPHFQDGLTTSIHAGIQAAAAHSDGFMICLSDLPFIEANEFNHLINQFQNALRKFPQQIQVPVFQGKRGNPVIFSAYYRNEILEHKEQMGCKGIVRQNREQVLEVEMTLNHILMDIDTAEDYHEALQNL